MKEELLFIFITKKKTGPGSNFVQGRTANKESGELSGSQAILFQSLWS